MMLTVLTWTALSLAESSRATPSSSRPDGMTGRVKETERSGRSFWSSAIASERRSTESESFSASPSTSKSASVEPAASSAAPYASASSDALSQTSASSGARGAAEGDPHRRAGVGERRDPGLHRRVVDRLRPVPRGHARVAVDDHERQVVRGGRPGVVKVGGVGGTHVRRVRRGGRTARTARTAWTFRTPRPPRASRPNSPGWWAWTWTRRSSRCSPRRPGPQPYQSDGRFQGIPHGTHHGNESHPAVPHVCRLQIADPKGDHGTVADKRFASRANIPFPVGFIPPKAKPAASQSFMDFLRKTDRLMSFSWEFRKRTWELVK